MTGRRVSHLEVVDPLLVGHPFGPDRVELVRTCNQGHRHTAPEASVCLPAHCVYIVNKTDSSSEGRQALGLWRRRRTGGGELDVAELVLARVLEEAEEEAQHARVSARISHG